MKPSQVHLLSEVMEQAHPYIKKYQDKIIVVKYGGNAMINEELKMAVMQDLLLLNQIGIKVVLVHGGGPEISQGLKLIGKESKFINGLRVTDKETIEIVQQMLAGKINKSLVALLKGKGIGLCGIDGQMLLCEPINEELGFVGAVKQVNTKLLDFALNSGLIPVIATVGVDEQGTAYNVNADTAASKIAIALGAEKLVSMTDIVGVLKDRFDDTTLIPQIEISEVNALVEQGIITDGMIPKIECCIDCVREGVKSASIIDGRVPHALLIETFTSQGNGTLFYKRKNDE
ncbi:MULTISPECIES: acetylglutamate kinase [Glaesserella]|uniref:Acetylglutamate kinase n=1 Tax=Glaesserella australis TaxID=2094024 RepID=A0A328BXS9_9PAST|nr:MULTISPECIES: acetylglutamate kinase [Glaesserella]AUI65647.1 acetylglutamate kinase [Glaesserella sp. 15-184]RAL19066.1 acetylglutamate kinase [Glaesserella australis]